MTLCENQQYTKSYIICELNRPDSMGSRYLKKDMNYYDKETRKLLYGNETCKISCNAFN